MVIITTNREEHLNNISLKELIQYRCTSQIINRPKQTTELKLI